MTGSLLLLALAVGARTAHAAVRALCRPLVLRLPGSILGASAAWLIAGAAGGWSPWWPALAAGAASFAIEGQRLERPVRIALEALVVLAAALLSLPPMALPLALLALCGTILLGAVADRVIPAREHDPRFARRVPLLLLVGALTLLGATLGAREGAPPAAHLLDFGVTPLRNGEAMPLRSGAVAWLERPQGRGSGEGALLFHGAHPAGAHQASASVLRRALLDAGYVVLSVDHPGYGASRCPPADADVPAWDPLPVAADALGRLRRLIHGGDVLLVGHSLGTSDVLRLLPIASGASHAVLFGAGLRDPRDSGEYWYGRFHTDRRMALELPRDRFEQIRLRYYENARLAAALPRGTVPILFVRFGHEHRNIRATRDSLYRLLPQPKSLWTLGRAKHSLTSTTISGLLVGDTGVAREVGDRLRMLRDRPGSRAGGDARAPGERSAVQLAPASVASLSGIRPDAPHGAARGGRSPQRDEQLR